MKSFFIWLSLLLLVLPSYAGSAEKAWEEFLNNPNPTSHGLLTGKLTQCGNSVCLKEIAPNSSDVTKLLELVQRGDPRAVDIAFLAIRFLDGGDLEDTYRELGLLTESNPKLFLTQAKNHHVTDHQMRRLLRMLPLDTVDNIRKKQHVVKRRIERLSKVEDSSLKDIKNKSISILREYLAQLKND